MWRQRGRWSFGLWLLWLSVMCQTTPLVLDRRNSVGRWLTRSQLQQQSEQLTPSCLHIQCDARLLHPPICDAHRPLLFLLTLFPNYTCLCSGLRGNSGVESSVCVWWQATVFSMWYSLFDVDTCFVFLQPSALVFIFAATNIFIHWKMTHSLYKPLPYENEP